MRTKTKLSQSVLFGVTLTLLGTTFSSIDAQKSARKPPRKTTATTAPKPGPAKPLSPKTVSESDTLFSSNRVLEINLELSEDALNSLRRDPRTYVKATLKEGNKVYTDVAVHLRGAAGSTRSVDDKPGLTFNMNKFTKDQSFYGMDKFHLANSVQDPTYVSELLCGEMFREAGVPASRIAHAVVTINGRKCGLYYLKEGYDKNFLTRNFQVGTGNFYDGGFLRDIDQPLELNSGKDDVKDQAELRALAAATEEPDPHQRFKKLEKLLDMDRFITFLALEMIVWDWDGYPMNRNNYRIYHDPKRDKIIFLPSGMDQMFQDVGGPIFPGFQGLVARSVMETPEGRTRYLARVREILKTTYRTEARIKRLNELEAKIKPVLASLNEDGDYRNHMSSLRQRIQERARHVEEQLTTMQ